MNTITIPRSLLDDGGATPGAVMLYASISAYAKYCVTERPEIYMPLAKLQHDLYGDRGRGSFYTGKTREVVAELEAAEILRFDKKDRSVMIRREAFYPDRYVVIYGGELDKIRECMEPSYFQWLFFCYFCHAVMSFSAHTVIDGRTGIIGFMPQKYFAEKLDVGQQTISEYSRRLEELEMLYVAHRAGTYSTNVYCRYADRGLLKKYLNVT